MKILNLKLGFQMINEKENVVQQEGDDSTIPLAMQLAPRNFGGTQCWSLDYERVEEKNK